jgi:tRNA(Ile2) C34 agmatinyltransferase TiaS
MTRNRDPKPGEVRLAVFECPGCGRRLEALPSSEIRCRCGRAMERMKPGRPSARATRGPEPGLQKPATVLRVRGVSKRGGW